MKKYFLILTILIYFPVSNAAVASPPAGGGGAGFCPELGGYLSKGSRGEEVKGLQSFLSYQGEEIYPAKLVTGYFGILTESAVKNFQSKYGIVSSGSPKTTGYGAVGPKTRQKIKEVCDLPSQLPLPTPPTPATGGVGAPTSSVGAAPIGPSFDLKVNGSDGPINLPKNSSAAISWTLSNHPWQFCTKLGSWSGSVKPVSGSESTENLSYDQTYTMICYLDSKSFQDSVTVRISQGTSTPPPPAGGSAPTPPPSNSTSTQAAIPPPSSSGGMDCRLDVSPAKAVIGKDAVGAKWVLTSAPVNWPFYWHNIDNGVETGHLYGGKTTSPYNVDTVDYPVVPGKYTRYVHIVADPLWVTTNDVNHPSATCTTNAATFEVSN